MTEQLKPSGRFTKKPVTIDAWRIDLDNAQPDWVRTAFGHDVIDWSPDGEGLYINTLEGLMVGNIGDWLIRGIKEELYACKSEIFDATYSPADEGAQPAQAVPASCGECGKKTSDGWALYCVACMEKAGLPAQAVPLLTDAEIDQITDYQWDAHAQYLHAAYRAYARAIEQAVRAKMDAAQWQPISTAPKDGTPILLARDHRVTAGHWEPERYPTATEYHSTTGEYLGQFETGEVIDAWWYSEDGGFDEENPPTHWMQLPPPPIVGKEGGE